MQETIITPSEVKRTIKAGSENVVINADTEDFPLEVQPVELVKEENQTISLTGYKLDKDGIIASYDLYSSPEDKKSYELTYKNLDIKDQAPLLQRVFQYQTGETEDESKTMLNILDYSAKKGSKITTSKEGALIIGSTKKDTINLYGSSVVDTNSGNDKVYIKTQDGQSLVFSSGDGKDTIYNSTKADNVYFEQPSSSELNYYKAARSNDLVVNYTKADSVTISNYFGSDNRAYIQGLFDEETNIQTKEITVSGKGKIYGTNLNDKITGSNSSDTIHTYAGDDTVYALKGNDNIIIAEGNSDIDGNKKVVVSAGKDTISGIELLNDDSKLIVQADSYDDAFVSGHDIYLGKDAKNFVKIASGLNNISNIDLENSSSYIKNIEDFMYNVSELQGKTSSVDLFINKFANVTEKTSEKEYKLLVAGTKRADTLEFNNGGGDSVTTTSINNVIADLGKGNDTYKFSNLNKANTIEINDTAGNDTYNGTIYNQDTYNSTSVTIIDGNGKDHYELTNENSLSITDKANSADYYSINNAFDNSYTYIVDAKGNDYYELKGGHGNTIINDYKGNDNYNISDFSGNITISDNAGKNNLTFLDNSLDELQITLKDDGVHFATKKGDDYSGNLTFSGTITTLTTKEKTESGELISCTQSTSNINKMISEVQSYLSHVSLGSDGATMTYDSTNNAWNMSVVSASGKTYDATAQVSSNGQVQQFIQA